MYYIKQSMIGRPPIPKSKRRSTILLVRVTKAERSAILTDAKRAGLSLSEYLRHRLLHTEKTKT